MFALKTISRQTLRSLKVVNFAPLCRLYSRAKEDLFFTKSHEWISKDGYMGITHHAQDGLGEITHVDFQVNVGDTVSQGDCICVVESIKTVSDVYAPVSGKIQEVNEDLMDDANAKLINESCYDKGWIVKIEPEDFAKESAELMNHEAYEPYAASEGH